MSRQCADEARGLQVPDLEGARRRPGADELLGVAEPHALHRRRVTAEALQGGEGGKRVSYISLFGIGMFLLSEDSSLASEIGILSEHLAALVA